MHHNSESSGNIISEALSYLAIVSLVMLAIYSIVMLPNNLVAINSCYYLVGFGINKFKPSSYSGDDGQAEQDEMYYYKLI